MLAELNEADATGDVARIYADVRRQCAVPYVSALYRHLATRPGVLPWAWTAVSPALENGTAQEAGWRVAADLPLEPLPSIPRDACASGVSMRQPSRPSATFATASSASPRSTWYSPAF